MDNLEIIRNFAAIKVPTKVQHDEAVQAHNELINTAGYWTSPEGLFMREVNNPCPDYCLKAFYRKQVLQKGK